MSRGSLFYTKIWCRTGTVHGTYLVPSKVHTTSTVQHCTLVYCRVTYCTVHTVCGLCVAGQTTTVLLASLDTSCRHQQEKTPMPIISEQEKEVILSKKKMMISRSLVYQYGTMVLIMHLVLNMSFHLDGIST